jgi:hypothetical protein
LEDESLVRSWAFEEALRKSEESQNWATGGRHKLTLLLFKEWMQWPIVTASNMRVSHHHGHRLSAFYSSPHLRHANVTSRL